ncbi:hypothetical protein K492DRAFT_115984, partial [Lichtheimia hyalospora FSU 10163]
DSLQWSQVAAKAAGMKVVTPSRSSRDSATMSSDILFELPEFSQQQLARKAAAIIRQALSPDTVLFSFPRLSFSHHTEAYKLIVDQIGPLASVRPLSNYDVRARRDLLIAAKFTCTEHTTAAIDSGVSIDNVIYKASPTSSGIENPLMRVQLNLLHNADDRYIKDDLLSSLRYYGKVYQIRRVLCNGYFEGQLTVTLDPSEGYIDDDGNLKEAQPLQRMLYLEAWDVFAPASFRGAAPICYYCRQAGHIRKACPELAKRVCFGCGKTGHTRRYCRARETEKPTETDLLQQYEEISKSASTQPTPVTEPDMEAPDQLDSNRAESSLNASDMDDLTTEQVENPFHPDDDEMDIEELDSNTEQQINKKKSSVDPRDGLNASIHAPYATATTMKVDSQAEMLGISSVKQATKAKSEKIKRNLVKNKSSTTSKSS